MCAVCCVMCVLCMCMYVCVLAVVNNNDDGSGGGDEKLKIKKSLSFFLSSRSFISTFFNLLKGYNFFF